MEDLLSRHRKEQKDLQAKITQKKKAATKKTRRGVNDECDRLQRDLTERQQTEIAELNGEPTAETELPVDELEDLTVNDNGVPLTNGDSKDLDGNTQDGTSPMTDSSSTSSAPVPSSGTKGKKPNRQKARLARRAAEQAAQAQQAEEEASKQTNHRGNEKEAMDAVFKKLKLNEIDITPDGHCLFSAVATQLDELGLGLQPDPTRIILQPATQSRVDCVGVPQHDGYRAVRAVTADFITAHRDDFEAFMEKDFVKYTKDIRDTAEWGGQLELQAIARAYGVDINVIQGDGRIEKIEAGDAEGAIEEEERRRRVIWLAYYRHTYGLGEHYNALTAKA
ncbi:hypothetical protein BJY04DRAFT_188675 [Aspergillus karnatakaensis]|uniref:deubiquitinase OTU2 n=1 Tax=Aspergillus karnatakaensis TaxID=1810916 RepID=UPI003CCCF65C